MSFVCLLDSPRLSRLLRETLSWNDSITSLMVSATNGSILAYAFRNATPSIKAMRTLSTTMTTAHTVALEDILVFEAQNTNAISVITPIADHILLAVTGPESNHKPKPTTLNNIYNGQPDKASEETERPDQEHNPEEDDLQRQIRADLEIVSQELAPLLREELSDLKWPDDI